MTMQETNRYERAAVALDRAGQRVTHARLDRWLREHDGRGLSPRESVPIVRRYRDSAQPRISSAVESCIAALAALPAWERAEVLRRVRRENGGMP